MKTEKEVIEWLKDKSIPEEKNSYVIAGYLAALYPKFKDYMLQHRELPFGKFRETTINGNVFDCSLPFEPIFFKDVIKFVEL